MYKFIQIFLFTIAILFVTQSTSIEVDSSSGIAVTGSFAEYHFQLLPGEIVQSEEIFVLFYNNYLIDIDVELTSHVYDMDNSEVLNNIDISFLIEITTVSIAANTSIRIPIGIALTEDAAAGEYQLGLSANVIPSQYQGITITGSAELRTKLSIFGEAGDLELYTYDMFGDSILTELKLYRRDGDSTVLIRTFEDIMMRVRLVPGQYVVVGTFKDYEVIREEFIIADRTLTAIHSTAQTLFIEAFNVIPLVFRNTEILSHVQVQYTLINIHRLIENTRLVLNVSFNDILHSQEEESMIPYLPVNIVEGSFNYSSPLNWKVGTYEFILEVYVGDLDENESDYVDSSSLRSLILYEQHVQTILPMPSDDNISWIQKILSWTWPMGLILVFSIVITMIDHRKKKNLDAVEYTRKQLKKYKIHSTSSRFEHAIDLVEKTMGPGTKFFNEKKGSKHYYIKVDIFLEEHQILKDM